MIVTSFIYAAQPNYITLRQFIATYAPAVSGVSYVEVLGYHGLSPAEKQHFTAFFAAATVLPISQPVLEEAVKLRQQRKMTLGDAFIAATCLVHGLTLVTRNTKNFLWIAGLKTLDPLAGNETQPNAEV